MFTGSGVYTDITVCIDCVSVDVHKESSAKSARENALNIKSPQIQQNIMVISGDLTTPSCPFYTGP